MYNAKGGLETEQKSLLTFSNTKRQHLNKRFDRIKRILTYARDTRVSRKIVLAFLSEHYWLIANNFCPYCHNRYKNFGILVHHITYSHMKEVSDDYIKLKNKIR